MLKKILQIIEQALHSQGNISLDWELALSQLESINSALDETLIIAITDVTGHITFVNQKFCEISKYSQGELLGQDHRIINSGYHSKTFFRNMWRTIARGEIWRGEVRNRAKDNTIYWMDTTVVPLLNDQGKPSQYVSFRNEITARKDAEEALRRSEKAATAGQIASGFVHEIRNPLAAMKWNLQLLQMEVPEKQTDVDAILTELERVDGIVGELLMIAKPKEVPLEVIHIADILDVVVHLMRTQARQQNIELHLTIETDVPLIRCEPNKLRQVFINLIKNSLESMSQRGIVTIRATRSTHNDRLNIQIVDQGSGIPEEVISRLGEPFISTKRKGTGLGLMVTHQIIHTHHGNIDFESPPGKGTSVTISLPGIVEEAVGF